MQQNCKALQKVRFLREDKKNRYGKADAYHSDFFTVFVKKIAFEADTVLWSPAFSVPFYLRIFLKIIVTRVETDNYLCYNAYKYAYR